MSKILLDYVFPISVITPTPAASTAFLKQACVVAKPKSGQEGNVGTIYLCTSMTAVSARTDNVNAQQLFNAGMSRVYVLLSNSLDIASALASHLNDFYTILVSDDFVDEDLVRSVTVPGVKATIKIGDITYTAKTAGAAGDNITIQYVDDGSAGAETVNVTSSAIVVHMESGVSTAQQIADAITASTPANALVDLALDSGDESDAQVLVAETALDGGVTEEDDEDTGLDAGEFSGVIGVQTQDGTVAAAQAAIANRCCFKTSSANKAKNLFFAFGSLLSNASNWLNQQFISMPYSNDDIATLGDAETLFDGKVSFVLTDDEFGNRLALFAAGGKAIVAPYIVKNLMIDLQSASLTWISGNQPRYTKKEAALLENRLQEDVANLYISRTWISAGVVDIALESSNFVGTGSINIAEPKALWRVFSELRQTL